MPFIPYNENNTLTPSATPNVVAEEPSFLDVLPPAFRQENDVNAAWDYITGPRFQSDPQFEVQPAMDASPYRFDYYEQLGRAQSQDEFDHISNTITQEQEDRAMLASSGGAGISASIVAGMASPTMFIPLLGPAKGVKGVAQALALGATAATSQEAALYLSQETRTGEEVALGIGAGTILSGALGSAAVYLRSSARARIEADMAHGQGPETISYAAGTSARAAVKEAPVSPPKNLAEPIPAYRPKVSQVDDDVVVFDGQGTAVVARVTDVEDELVLETGETVELGGSFTEHNPRVPEYRLQTMDAVPEIRETPLREDIEKTARAATKQRLDELEEKTVAKLDERLDVIDTHMQDALRAAGELDRLRQIPLPANISATDRIVDIGDMLETVSRDLPSGHLRTTLEKLQSELIDIEGELFSRAGKQNVPVHLREGIEADEFAIAEADAIRDAGVKVPAQRVVAKLSDAVLIDVAARLENALAATPASRKSATVTRLEQDLVATISEARRREVKTPELKTLAAKGDNLPEQAVPVQGDLPGVPESVGAAVAPGALRPFRRISRTGPISGWVNDQLAKLNPVTRLLNNKQSAVGSFWSAKFADAGLVIEGNQGGIAHAVGGTISDRANAHQVALGKFVQSYDNAYANYVNGTTHAVDDAEGVFQAKARSGLGQLPEGIMSWEEFGSTTFRLANTGEDYADSAVMAGVKAQLSLYDYFRKVAADAFEDRKLLEGNEARQLFDPEGNLGPDIENYIHHIYDTQTIGNSPTEFKTTIRNNAIQQQQSSFTKAMEKFVAKEDGEQATLDILQMDKKARKAVQAQVDTDIAGLETQPEMATYMAERKQLMDERTVARATEKEARPEVDITGMTSVQADAALAKHADELAVATQDLVDAEAAVKAYEASASQTVLGIQARLQGIRRYDRKLKGTPDSTPAKITAQEARMEKAREQFTEKWRKRGGTDISIAARSANFDEYGDEVAEQLYNNITGMGARVSGMDILQGARGPELSRALNLPFDQKVKWLHTDPEHIIRRYVRQMSSDVEIYRSTGSPNGMRIFQELTEEFDNLRLRLDTATHVAKVDGAMRPVPADTKGAKVVTDDLRKTLLNDLRKEQNRVTSDMTVLIDRQRHLRGMPDNPEGWAFRGGRMAMDMNVTRLMGTVVLSSMSEVARPVMKRGLVSTFRDGYAPMVSDLKRLKMTRENARELGIAWDPILHNRTQAVFEMMEDNGLPRTGLEKVTGFLANKTGLVAGFDRWTAEMKMIAASVGMSESSRMLRAVATGEGTAKQIAEATTFLAAHGVDKPLVDKIWKQFMKPGGSTEFDGGVRLPNLEAWADDYKAMSAYRALIGKFTDDTIITPGLDRPSWVDANTAAKMLAQFRSFTFTSTNRVIMAGLQQQDMALINGMTISLAMGALSYYLWATSVGGKVEAQMLSGDLDKWADESIARSGLTGIFAEAQRVAERIPGLEQFATFAGTPVRNRQPTSLIGSIAGPSYDLAERLSKVVLGMNEPTQQTLHQARLMQPYQNVFWWRQQMDAIEDAAAEALDLPERRSN